MHFFHIPALQLKSHDPDFRYMGLNDLLTTVQSPGAATTAGAMAMSVQWTDDLLRRTVPLVLDLIADKNGEVQNMAVKTYVLWRSISVTRVD